MRIESLRISGFRGFNTESTISLDSNVVLVYGLNGSGKSSFTEALEWLFFGEISRQRLSACPSEYQHDEYLRNLFYQEVPSPFVEVSGTVSGNQIVIRRELVGKKEKRYLNGAEVTDWAGLPLKLESAFRPMLAQTEIKALVDSEQVDRWEQLASILGQDDLTKLRAHLLNLRSSKRDVTFKDEEGKWGAMKSEAMVMQDLPKLGPAMASLKYSAILDELRTAVGKADGTTEELLEIIDGKQKALLHSGLGQRVVGVAWLEAATLSSFLQVPLTLLEEWLALHLVATQAGYDHDHLMFLRIGSVGATPPHCPFCLTASLTEERTKQVAQYLAEAQSAEEAMKKAGEKARLMREWLATRLLELTNYFPLQKDLQLLAQGLLDIGSEKLAKEVQEFEKASGGRVSELIKCRRVTVTECLSCCQSAKPQVATLEPLMERLRAESAEGMAIHQEYSETWKDLKARIAQVVPLTGKNEQDALKRWIALERIVGFAAKSRPFFAKGIVLARLDSLQKKLEQFEKEEVERLLTEHAKEISDYYKRLNPDDNVTFAGIEVKPGIRRQAKLKANAYGKVVNPVTFFSEAHTNSLALSIYFPQRVDRNTTWEVVVLDDPVQSMDANHSQALIEILVETAKVKQVIVLTHSKDFWRRLRARFGPDHPKAYNFYSNDATGPKVVLEKSDTIAHLEGAAKHLKAGDAKSLEEASALLRKAIESVCFEYLLEKGTAFNRAKALQMNGLPHLFAESEKQGMAAGDIAKLRSLLPSSHPDSHAISLVDTTSGGLKTGAGLIREVYQAYLT